MALNGGCGSRTYQNVGSNTIDAIIAGLTRGGATITGNNPWTVDTHQSDVVLRGTWDAATNTLQVAVLDSAFYAPCSSVWNALEERIAPIIRANPPTTTPTANPPTANPPTANPPTANQLSTRESQGVSTGLKLVIALGLGVGAFILIRHISRSSATAPPS